MNNDDSINTISNVVEEKYKNRVQRATDTALIIVRMVTMT